MIIHLVLALSLLLSPFVPPARASIAVHAVWVSDLGKHTDLVGAPIWYSNVTECKSAPCWVDLSQALTDDTGRWQIKMPGGRLWRLSIALPSCHAYGGECNELCSAWQEVEAQANTETLLEFELSESDCR